MIHWTVRFKNKSFWLSFVPAVLILVQVTAALLGFELELEGAAGRMLDVVNALFAVLALLGMCRPDNRRPRRQQLALGSQGRRRTDERMGRRGVLAVAGLAATLRAHAAANTTLTRLAVLVEELSDKLSALERSNSAVHTALADRIGRMRTDVGAHETRITVLEKNGGKNGDI